MINDFAMSRFFKSSDQDKWIDFSPKKLIIYLLAVPALFIVVLYIFFWLSGVFLFYDNFFLPPRQEFIDSAQWLQALAVVVTAIVGFYLLNQLKIAGKQLSLNAEQLKLQQKLTVAEINKRLASKEFSRVRRFLHNADVKIFFKKKVAAIARLANKDNYDQMYFLFKQRFYDFKKYSSEYSYIRIEDIEMLLNEYNLVGMLDRDGISAKMFTKKALENAKIMYEVLESYILLRRAVSSGKSEYASDYENWITK